MVLASINIKKSKMIEKQNNKCALKKKTNRRYIPDSTL